VAGWTSVHSPPLIEYSAFSITPKASRAFQRTLSLPAAGAASRPVISGGVLSITSSSLTSSPVSACAGGFDGASLVPQHGLPR
jgi:hypothetical protein